MNRKIILYGGSFDPIHNGHLAVARHALDHIGADELVFVPARRSPFKKQSPVASDDDRMEMIGLAISGLNGFAVSDCELKRPEPSYTIDTVRHFRHEYGEASSLYLLIGADAIKELPRWYKINDLLKECTICLMLRPGYEVPDVHRYDDVFGREMTEKLEKNALMNPLVDISSTDIRKRSAAGEDISGMVPEKVCQYIRAKGLYR
jgi:nicotinate-nucleotide adenylyltransferase